MEFLTDMVTTVPEGTSSTKVDELRALRQRELLNSPKRAIWFDSGTRPLVLANGAALDCSEPSMRQSFVKSSPHYHFISG